MVKYFLSYDLRNNRDYQKLYDELAAFNSIQVLESLHCFKYQDSKTKELRDHFAKFIDSDDGLIVIKPASWAARKLDNSPNDL